TCALPISNRRFFHEVFTCGNVRNCLCFRSLFKRNEKAVSTTFMEAKSYEKRSKRQSRLGAQSELNFIGSLLFLSTLAYLCIGGIERCERHYFFQSYFSFVQLHLCFSTY